MACCALASLWQITASRDKVRCIEAYDTIDSSVRDLLAQGKVRLLSVGWLVANRQTPEPPPLSRRQDLPERAFVAPDEAVRLHDRGMVFVLSYRWLTAFHPDPLGATLSLLLQAFESSESDGLSIADW